MGLTNPVDVVILGGGISGLACALRLRNIVPEASVALIDAGTKLGGKVCGEVVESCVVDGGPDLCIESKLSRAHAFHQLGLATELIPVNPAGLPTFRRSGGRLTAMPGVVTDGLVTMRGGMHDIVNLMVSAIRDVRLHLGSRVTSIVRSPAFWTVRLSDGTRIDASAVVSALPATPAAAIFREILPAFSRVASTVRYTPMTTVTAAWTASQFTSELHGTGFIESEPVEGALTACTWTTSKIPMRSPYDVLLMRGYVRTSEPGTATRIAIEDMMSSNGLWHKPLWTRAYAWDDALPQYPPDHQSAVRNLRDELETLTDFAFAGAAWDGVGIGDCMCSGESAAERVAAALQPA